MRQRSGRVRPATDETPAEAPEAPRGYASPPCYQHDIDPVYQGCLAPGELIEALTGLLEGERAGTRGLREMSALAESADLRACLAGIARDEARCCALLTRHLRRLGAVPSRATGAFLDKLRACNTLPARLALLDRGQSAVVATLNGLIAHTADDALRDDLRAMRDLHVRNLERCAALADA